MERKKIWQNRLAKFRDHPPAVIPFLKKHLYYNRVADSYLPYYKYVHFLSYQETIDTLITDGKSFARFGDEAFDMINGIGLYFKNWRQRYHPELARRYREVIGSNHPRLLLGFNPELFLMTRADFAAAGIPEQHQFWTNTKIFLKDYLNEGQVYGRALCFQERYHTAIDYQQIIAYLKTRHLLIVASNTARFKNAQLGVTTDYIEGPGSDAWDHYDTVLSQVCEAAAAYPKEKVLVLGALGPTTKVLVYDLIKDGYAAWDTGQLFDIALKRLV